MGDELAGRPLLPARVVCHSGHEYPERPVALYWQGERLEIQRVEGEWRTPEGKKFRVCTQDGQVFEILYHAFQDEWLVVPL